MAIKVKWKSAWITLVIAAVVSTLTVDGFHSHDTVPSARFSKVQTVRADVRARTKRDAAFPGVHSSHTQVHIQLNDEPHVLDLVLNRHLLAKDVFVRADYGNGSHQIHRFAPQDEELCQYHGSVRGVADSSAAVSLCDGVRGVVFMKGRTFYLEQGLTPEDTLVYDSNHLIEGRNNSCGFPDTPPAHRVRRDADEIRGPYNENEQSRYVELVLVVDMDEYKEMGENLRRVYRHCKDIANIINSLFVPLNIFVALVGVVVWTDANQIKLTPSGDNTLTNFLQYRRQRLLKEHPNDNAQLLTKIKFEGGVVGKALKGPICTYEYSGGVSMDHSTVLGLVATTVAHEMGHNFGMEHDSADCQCPDEKCIMAPSSSHTSPLHWSSCSLEYLALAFEHGMDYCLRNKPTHLFDSPMCGNGFVEPGEQCDCGLPKHCDNVCCNPNNCMLYDNATCATGRCCNLQTCQPVGPGRQCRKAEHECDLPEFCTGESEYCPDDVFKMDGETCRKGKAYCYQGKCRTHSDQCKLLWGDSGNSSDDECYDKNTLGTRHGNCGYHRLNSSYVKCNDVHVQCGMVHCKHQNERLEFGMESVSILAHTFINKAGSIVPCRTAIVDLGLNEVDPGLAPDGAKCGENMMCVNQRCMSVGALRARSGTQCPEDCNGNGVCNSKGHCHCAKGLAPPLCKYPGTGGSQDSGPASDPNATRDFTTALYVIFLGVVPLIAAAGCLFLYWKRDPRVWGPRKSPSTPSSNALLDTRCSEKAGKSEGSDHASLSAGNLLDGGHRPIPISPIQKELIGQFKGFSIKPIEKEEDQYQATNLLLNNSVPVAGIAKSPALRMQNKWNNMTAVRPPAAPNVSFRSPKPKQRTPADNICKVDVGSLDVLDPPQRVEISQPVLEGTTSCTAKELIDAPLLQPTRPAPAAPSAPPVPSVSSAPLPVPDQIAPMPPHEPREYPTLTKIANIMRNASVKSVNEKHRKPHIDREKLRGLEISNPIPQMEEEAVQERSGPSVQRAQSMREATPPRQPLTFGSMRGGKRPTSVHVPSRPTSPPPRPPPQPPQPPQQVSKEYSYDDCLNLLSEKQAPLAHIDEESSPTSANNIYAVIEESPPAATAKTTKAVRFTEERYEVPKPVADPASLSPLVSEKPLSTSTESMGLLGEIVNEIQSRNLESIYSAGTLKRKKKEAEERGLKESGRYENSHVESADEGPTYQPSDVSSASSSNGYLSPKNINVPVSSASVTPVLPTPPISQAETDSKLKDIDVANYKPYASSFVRSSGPLSMAYSKKSEGSIATPLPTNKPETTLTSNRNFSRPGLLGTPTPAKFTPQAITSSFKLPKTSNLTSPLNPSGTEGSKSPAPSNPTPPPKTTTPLTISKTAQEPIRTTISEVKSLNPTLTKIPPKVAPRPKDKIQVQRPLPSIPKKSSEAAAPFKPLPAVPPKTEGDIVGKPGLRRVSDGAKPRLNGKPSPPNAALKPRLHSTATSQQ